MPINVSEELVVSNFRALFCSENAASRLLRNTGIYLPNDMELHPRTQQIS
jgi:hypothetical protein